MIRTDSDEYFIEPLEKDTQELEDQGRVHVVYRRSALLRAAPQVLVDFQVRGRTPRRFGGRGGMLRRVGGGAPHGSIPVVLTNAAVKT